MPHLSLTLRFTGHFKIWITHKITRNYIIFSFHSEWSSLYSQLHRAFLDYPMLLLLRILIRNIFSISFAGFPTSAHTVSTQLTYILRAFPLPFKIVFLYRPPHKYDPWQSSLFYTEFSGIEFYSISIKPMHKLHLEILIKMFTKTGFSYLLFHTYIIFFRIDAR